MPFERPEAPKYQPRKIDERRIETVPMNIPTRKEDEDEKKRREEDPNRWREFNK